jgi:bifunctional DNase/RNase
MTRSKLAACACVLALAAMACGGAATARPPEEDPRQVPAGYVRMQVQDVISLSAGDAVLLVDMERTRLLPIFIGGTEAVSIALRLRNQPAPRPLTHDLLDSVIRQLGGELVKVQVDRLTAGTFVGSIFVRTASGTRRIDARPSDAIALALGNRAPIYVARTVLEQSGLKPSQLESTEA